MMNTLIVCLLQADDALIHPSQGGWIGFATVVAVTLLGIIRQELVARRTAQKVEIKSEETRQEVKEQIKKTAQVQKEVASEHAEEIKSILKESAVVVADAAVNRYEDAAIWRQYVDQQIKLFNQGNERLANIMRRVEVTGLALKNGYNRLPPGQP
jgi:hypothetical protein